MEHSFNERLNQLADEYEVPIQRLIDGGLGSRLTVEGVLRSSFDASIWIDGIRPIDYFKLEIRGDGVISREDGSGTKLFLVKTKKYMEEREIRNFVLAHIDGMIRVGRYRNQVRSGDLSNSAMNNILDLLEKPEAKSLTSKEQKWLTIKRQWKTIIQENQWKIRDGDLIVKASYWIRDTILHDDVNAYANFCRLKVMTHGNVPIYEMQELE